MDIKIQELTDKIYREGVEKGNEEAGRIISEAQEQRRAILHDAQVEAEQMLTHAAKQTEALKKSAEAELKLFAAHFVEDLRNELTDLIVGKIVKNNIQPLTQDTAFMQQIVLEIAKKWAGTEGMTIRSAAAEELHKYIESNAKELLDRENVKIEKINGKPASFTILPADGTYKVVFGEDEFMAFFKEYLRPQIVALLF
ncbi:MAG: hypothetical protein LBE56_02660 [Tannerella sp.]|jgi:V/A-type H+-transporting ATPase subunit E|nr:hypothetical protein [Tannerella sp.]